MIRAMTAVWAGTPSWARPLVAVIFVLVATLIVRGVSVLISLALRTQRQFRVPTGGLLIVYGAAAAAALVFGVIRHRMGAPAIGACVAAAASFWITFFVGFAVHVGHSALRSGADLLVAVGAIIVSSIVLRFLIWCSERQLAAVPVAGLTVDYRDEGELLPVRSGAVLRVLVPLGALVFVASAVGLLHLGATSFRNHPGWSAGSIAIGVCCGYLSVVVATLLPYLSMNIRLYGDGLELHHRGIIRRVGWRNIGRVTRHDLAQVLTVRDGDANVLFRLHYWADNYSDLDHMLRNATTGRHPGPP
jgi:hypothetical protein